jgi:uncharacterized protein involved in outer membrane biogenesis
LQSKAFTIKRLAFSNIAVSAIFNDHQLVVDNLQADAYQGHIHARGILTGLDAGPPRLAIHTNIKDIQLASLLADIRQTPSAIEAGTMHVVADLATIPTSWPSTLNFLTGTAAFRLQGLVMQGVNPEQRICEAVQSASGLLAKTTHIDNDKIIIRKMRGEAHIKNGIANITSLAAKLDALHAKAEGTVNFLRNTLAINAKLKQMHSARAASLCGELPPSLSAVAWPLHCEGNYKVDGGKDLCRVDTEILQIGTLPR